MYDSVALVSGGIDSVTMLYLAVQVKRYLPLVVIFDYDQASSKEMEFAKYHTQRLDLQSQVVKLNLPGASYVDSSYEATYVPMRNPVFLSIAASIAESQVAHTVLTGFHRSDEADPFWDTQPEFVEAFNVMLSLNKSFQITVDSPLESLSKREIISLGTYLEVDYSKTWSCMQNGKVACGKCNFCKVRLETFSALGQEDPLEYEVR